MRIIYRTTTVTAQGSTQEMKVEDLTANVSLTEQENAKEAIDQVYVKNSSVDFIMVIL